LQKAGQHLDCGGFARAVRAQIPSDFARPHLKVDVVNGSEAAESLCESPDFEH